MPQPDYSQIHVNVPLTNVSVAYEQDENDFIADRFMPMCPVDKQGDLYYIYTRDDWFRTIAEERAPGTESAGGGYDLSRDQYFCRKKAVHKDVTDDDIQNADSVFNLESDATRWVTQQMLLRRELDVVSSYLTTGIWTGASDRVGGVTNEFWSSATGTPIEDVTGDALLIKRLTGRKPNTMVLGATCFQRLMNSTEIIERVKYSGSGFLTEAVLAQAIQIPNVMVASAVVNVAPPGAALSNEFIFDTDAWIGYVAPSPGLMTPSAGYRFTWTGLLGAGATGTRIKNFYMPHIESTRVEGENAYDYKVVGSDLGIFYSGIVQ